MPPSQAESGAMFFDVCVSKTWLPGPWAKPFWVVELAKRLPGLCKEPHTYKGIEKGFINIVLFIDMLYTRAGGAPSPFVTWEHSNVLISSEARWARGAALQRTEEAEGRVPGLAQVPCSRPQEAAETLLDLEGEPVEEGNLEFWAFTLKTRVSIRDALSTG